MQVLKFNSLNFMQVLELMLNIGIWWGKGTCFLDELVVVDDVVRNPPVLKFKHHFTLLNTKVTTERKKKFLEFLLNALGHR